MATARKALSKFVLNIFNFTDISNEVRRPNARSIFNDWQHIDLECSQQDLDVPGVCVNNLPRVALKIKAAGIRTRYQMITSPTPYRCATKVHVGVEIMLIHTHCPRGKA